MVLHELKGLIALSEPYFQRTKKSQLILAELQKEMTKNNIIESGKNFFEIISICTILTSRYPNQFNIMVIRRTEFLFVVIVVFKLKYSQQVSFVIYASLYMKIKLF